MALTKKAGCVSPAERQWLSAIRKRAREAPLPLLRASRLVNHAASIASTAATAAVIAGVNVAAIAEAGVSIVATEVTAEAAAIAEAGGVTEEIGVTAEIEAVVANRVLRSRPHGAPSPRMANNSDARSRLHGVPNPRKTANPNKG